MTTDGEPSDAPNVKRPRLNLQVPPATAPPHTATGPGGGTATAVAGLTDDGSSLVAVPTIGDQTGAKELLPALQQLLSVYQVEYWALLEELRAKHSTVTAEPGTADQPATTASGAATTLQQLWQSRVASGEGRQAAAGDQQGKGPTPSGAQQGSVQQEQQQQQQEGGMTSPFAAVAQPYGDNRCGFATDSSTDQQQQHQQQQQVHVPSLQEAELMLQQLPAQDAGAADSQQLQEWRQRWSAVAPAVAGLEQLASAATLQYMDAQGGLACLCGQQGRWVLRRSAASIGRSTDAKGDVDIDLGKAAGAAGVGSKVSRLQAQLLLTADGSWSITNTGRAALEVNGQQVARGSTVALPHLSLLEVASLPLLFMVNSMAVQRAVARSVHVAM